MKSSFYQQFEGLARTRPAALREAEKKSVKRVKIPAPNISTVCAAVGVFANQGQNDPR